MNAMEIRQTGPSPLIDRRRLIALSMASLVAPLASGLNNRVAARADTIAVDYAYYNPSSLVLRRFGWLEEEFGREGTEIEWVLSAGSNKANEFLRSDAVDFGSTAGSAALLARANGSDIKTVYIYSKPEWTALVVLADSEITEVSQLEGKKIAATKGTDPYFFLLQTLREAGLSQSDVEIINLQHADGKTALERGQVDAWAGLDPFMAQTELEQGSKLIYRNIDFNTFGFLNARSEFLENYPEETKRVLAAYERARQWILDNPEEAAQILAEESSLSIEVARQELFERTVLTHNPVPSEEHAEVLRGIIPILEAENQLSPGADAEEALEELFAPQYILEVLPVGTPPASTPAT
ncbi:MAG TPA: aliphatic sulfonate ABC transporter substrate-binding protein [Thermomicrobiales bacterium]|nr:aliphatic sulfonate ABC transporter substrate-binding protein [Thermomicrobiales bacterium]